MATLRNGMLLAVLGATAGAALAGGLFVGRSATRLVGDPRLFVARGIIITAMLAPTVKRIDSLVEALRALARGDRHARVNVDDYTGGLTELARAVNEVGASLTEGEDPNLGPVRSEPRPQIRTRPRTST